MDMLSHFLTHRHALDALNALSLLEEHKVHKTLSELALEACRRESRRGPDEPTPTLRQLFLRHQASLAPEQTRYLQGQRWVGRFVCGAFGNDREAESLRTEEVETLLSRYESPTSYNSVAARIRAVFRWGLRERILTETPLAELELRRVPWHEPNFFPPDKVERIFRLAERNLGTDPFARQAGLILTMGFFAGVRSAEIQRARFGDLDLAGGVLRIPRPKGYTSGIRPRLVELERNARAWFGLFLGTRSGDPAEPLAPDFRKFGEWKKRVLSPEGLSWGNDAAHNVMRHTYATMHVGAFRNASATALNLGHAHASNMLEKHYRGLVPQEEARTYWAIFPATGPDR